MIPRAAYPSEVTPSAPDRRDPTLVAKEDISSEMKHAIAAPELALLEAQLLESLSNHGTDLQWGTPVACPGAPYRFDTPTNLATT